MLRRTLFTAALLSSTTVFASGEPHEHGAAALDIAVDGAAVTVMFRLPGSDGVGFERAPETDEERAAIEAANATLENPDLYGLPTAAGCTADMVSSSFGLEEDDHAHGDDHDHDDKHDDDKHAHDEHEKDEHAHGDHDEEAHAEDKHDHDDDHDHDEEAEGHAEFDVSLTFTCADPAALDAVSPSLFEAFPSLERIDARFIGPAGQTGATLTPDDAALELPTS